MMKKFGSLLLVSFVAFFFVGNGNAAEKKSLKDLLKQPKNASTATNTKTTASGSLPQQLKSLKTPDKLDATAKPAPLKELALGKASSATKTQGKNAQGAPVTYVTTTQKYQASAAFDQQVLLNPGTDVIYPGSVLLGHTIASGTYQEVTKGQKKALTLSYDLTNVKASGGQGKNKKGNTSGSAQGIVSESIVPTLSNFRILHNKIMGQNLGQASTTYTFEQTEVSSESDFNIKFNMGVGFNSGIVETSIKSGFEFGKGSKKHKYMVKFMETFYTVDVDQGADTFIYENFNVADFQGYRPVYVASVAYGRLAYLTIETDESWDTIKTNLDVAVDASMYGKYDAGFESAVSNLKKNAKINITVIGGSSVATNLDSFLNLLKTGGFSKNNPGKIIAYKLRFVDDNSIANTVYNNEYTLTKTEEQLGKGIDTTFTLYKIKCNANDGSGGYLELYGNFELTDGKTKSSLWSFPRSKNKKYKEVGETKENKSVTFRTPNENSSIDITLDLHEADGLAKDDDKFTNAAGTTQGNMPKNYTIASLEDGKDVVIRVYALSKKGQVINNEWVEFYLKVSKKYLY